MGLAAAAALPDPVPVELSSGTTVHVQAVPYGQWRELLEAHPSSDRRLRFDRATFIPAAFATCVEEAESDADVERFLLGAHPADVEQLLAAVLKLHDSQPEGPTQPRE